MKKIVALLLVLATVFLVSCGSESADIEDVLNELNSVGNETPDSSSNGTSSQSSSAQSMKLTFLGDCLVSHTRAAKPKVHSTGMQRIILPPTFSKRCMIPFPPTTTQ